MQHDLKTVSDAAMLLKDYLLASRPNSLASWRSTIFDLDWIANHEGAHPLPNGVSRFRAIVYLRLIDKDTPNECWVVCNKTDPGAVCFNPSFPDQQ